MCSKAGAEDTRRTKVPAIQFSTHILPNNITPLRILKITSNYTANLIYDILSSGAFVIPVTEFSLCLETPVRSVIVSVSRSYREVPSQI